MPEKLPGGRATHDTDSTVYSCHVKPCDSKEWQTVLFDSWPPLSYSPGRASSTTR